MSKLTDAELNQLARELGYESAEQLRQETIREYSVARRDYVSPENRMLRWLKEHDEWGRPLRRRRR